MEAAFGYGPYCMRDFGQLTRPIRGVTETENCDRLLGAIANSDRIPVPCGNVRADGDEYSFRFISWQPGNCLDRIREDSFCGSCVQFAHNPVLARAAEMVNPARSSLAEWFVKHHGGAHTPPTKND
jgi:hypothetical protein